MKTYLILFGLCLGGGSAFAATQTALDQDKPARLYVSQYTETHEEAQAESGTITFYVAPEIVTDVFDNVDAYHEAIHFADGADGGMDISYHGTQISYTLSTGSTFDDVLHLTWVTNLWPNVYGNLLETIHTSGYYGTNFSAYAATNANPSQFFPISPEGCDFQFEVSYPSPWGSHYISSDAYKTVTVQRHAQTGMKFQTGGKSVAGDRREFRLGASAAQVHYQNFSANWNSLGVFPNGSFAYQGWQITSNTDIPRVTISLGSFGALNQDGAVYAALPAGQAVDVTPTIPGVDYYRYAVGPSLVQTKADWQKVVQYEMNQDSGGQIENYKASYGFLTNRLNIQAVYAFYQKLFTEQPTHFSWAGLAKLAGAPVYAALSDAQHGYDWLAGMVSTNSPYDATNNLQTMASIQNLQNTLISMNIAILDDLAWQFEAYRKGGTNALNEAAVAAGYNSDVVNMSPWIKIDQGIQANNPDLIQDGSKDLLQREQQQVLANGYSILSAIPNVTTIMSVFAKNPVPTGPDFWTLEPNGNIANFNDRWDWITHAGNGMWPLWIATQTSTQLQWVEIPLIVNAMNYALISPVIP
jgi:hypothetical protein